MCTQYTLCAVQSSHKNGVFKWHLVCREYEYDRTKILSDSAPTGIREAS